MQSRGTTVIILAGIWGVHFFRNGGFGNLWGAITGQLTVK